MELMAFAFPHDSESPTFITEFPCILTEVANTFSVEFYTNDNRRFYSITRWDEHQRNERRAASRLPGPNDSESAPDKEFYGEKGFTDDTHGNSAHIDGNTVTGTGEQGNRGTGEQSKNIPAKQVSRSRSKLPDDWTPKLSHYELAAKLESEGKAKVDVDDLAAQFRDTIAATGNKYKYKDFDRAFSTWIRRHADEPRRGRPFGGYLTKTQKAQAEWDEDRRIHEQILAEQEAGRHAIGG